jgi:hypothetical protein
MADEFLERFLGSGARSYIKDYPESYQFFCNKAAEYLQMSLQELSAERAIMSGEYKSVCDEIYNPNNKIGEGKYEDALDYGLVILAMYEILKHVMEYKKGRSSE